ncbi:ABC transporter permease [Xylanibacillus composti]|uniref:ABC transporter permease n=1 Tax=Xylanibacillus composti TaxID=1572762 RepID=A0A8J4H208_9BACL|nr:FtsX-like permease family protein [Xylanibacillus composti]MDT9724891.1 ABC transporter permease [Xylanibacillus composti]GIQ68125.1 ABC transporter permease [Xylanibacillus composti]
MKPMFSLAMRLLYARKKWMVSIAAIFAIVISSVVSIFTSTETIKISIQHQAFQRYGEFSGMLYNIPNGEFHLSAGHKYAEYKLFDKIRFSNNLNVNIGWASADYFEMGHISLLSGDYPSEANEVAIESYYLEQISPSWKIGQTQEVHLGNETFHYKLVGIIENYSSRWTSVDSNYPNIFLANFESAESHYLIGYNRNSSFEKNLKSIQKIISDIGGHGYINERLFYVGLNDLVNISVITFAVKLAILVVASLSIFTTFSFFTVNQGSKLAVCKALGCTNKKLYTIIALQTISIYMLGTVLSIPIVYVLNKIIIGRTYGQIGIPEGVFGSIIGTALLWLTILLIIVLCLSYYSAKGIMSGNISRFLKGEVNSGSDSGYFDKNIDNYNLKLLLIQIQSFPKHAIFCVLTLTLSIIVVLFSTTIAKESTGLWTTDIDYYLTSQESIQSTRYGNHTVVLSKGLTFSPSDVKEVEQLEGIRHVEKIPYMFDVQSRISTGLLTPSIKKWVDSSDVDTITNTALLRNIHYRLDDLKDTNSDNPQENIVRLHIPGIQPDEEVRLHGKSITLSKAVKNEDEYEIKEWDFIIEEVMDDYEAGEHQAALKKGITIVLDEKYAIENEITLGYQDIFIYTDDSLDKEIHANIYNKVYALSEGIPGSLFQYIPDLSYDGSRIIELLIFLGRLSFFISLVLSVASIYAVITGKFHIRRRYWGICRSLGMSLNKVYLLMLYEVVLYFVLASLLSSLIYYLFLLTIHISYPILSYALLTITTLVSVFALLLASTIAMKFSLDRHSIASLLKINE